ncbi:DUF4025 domain-containing protein [Bacillus clarus]|uniref:DUF4025 domain-containing protein n=1 Tax=Bacillus clarus TaxID=2338372 RepID=A0A090YM56_9BACI|nr:YozQ family protein [Bacillus clarus]KFM99316.1 hypothetical protein DJ93_3884 [Bacillus clarus]RFT68282.1 DUF4025 domain-containing protein [Bacillus clarus]
MAKQQNKQNVKATNQNYTSETNNAVHSVVQEQISDIFAEGTIDVKLGTESSDKV